MMAEPWDGTGLRWTINHNVLQLYYRRIPKDKRILELLTRWSIGAVMCIKKAPHF